MSLFVHKSNISSKIDENYKNKKSELKRFYYDIYLKMHKYLLSLDYNKHEAFKILAKVINEYLEDIDYFSATNNITSQSKFRSTFLEELSEYLFKDLKQIKDNSLGFYNKNIYAGLKIGADMDVSIIYKDVDFCIGRKVTLWIDNHKETIIMPIVAVEVKTYLDATMFGEVQHSARLIKNAIPNAKTYVLMEYNDVAKEKIIAARHDNTIDEMFALRVRDDNKKYCFSADVLEDYYDEIKRAVESISSETVNPLGRLLDRKENL